MFTNRKARAVFDAMQDWPKCTKHGRKFDPSKGCFRCKYLSQKNISFLIFLTGVVLIAGAFLANVLWPGRGVPGMAAAGIALFLAVVGISLAPKG